MAASMTRWLTEKEAALYCGCSLYAFRCAGVQAFNSGGRKVYSTDALDIAKTTCPEITAPPLRSTNEKTYLYRHFDEAGNLLYVGVSISAVARLAGHKANSHWFDSIATVTIVPFETAALAYEAEKAAIQAERPLHNTQFLKKRRNARA